MKTEKLTIFVVDDSTVALETITKSLQRTIHCHVQGFTSAEECLHRMTDQRPDIILSDYYLDSQQEHKMNGDRMLQHIKMKYSSIPVIMYSSHNSIEVVMRLMKLGAIDFIPKEKNFLQTISGITIKQINKIKTDYEQKLTLRSFLLFMATAVTIWTILGLYKPNLLPYYLFGLAVWIIVWWAFVGNKKTASSEQV
jgi:DNA-binding NtrC family response regulator